MARFMANRWAALIAGGLVILIIAVAMLALNRGDEAGPREIEAKGVVAPDCRWITVDAEGWRFQSEAHAVPDDWPNEPAVEGILTFDSNDPEDELSGKFQAGGLSFDVRGGKAGEAFFPLGCIVPGT